MLKTNALNLCYFHDNSWHRSVCSWAKKTRKEKKKTSKRGAHTRPALSEAEKPNLACKVKKNQKRKETCSYYIIYWIKKGLGRRCTGSKVVGHHNVELQKPLFHNIHIWILPCLTLKCPFLWFNLKMNHIFYLDSPHWGGTWKPDTGICLAPSLSVAKNLCCWASLWGTDFLCQSKGCNYAHCRALV